MGWEVADSLNMEEIKEVPSFKSRAPGDGELRARLRRNKAFATGLLLFMTAAFIASKLLEGTCPWLAPATAFAEAAMVGAIADWFAVVALFRRPLSLPIPHTAIVQRHKDKFGEALANFIRTNFLVREALEAKLGSLDMIGWLGGLLSGRSTAKKIADKLVDSVVSVADRLDDRAFRDLCVRFIVENARSVKILPLLGKVLGVLVEQKRHQALLDEAVIIGSKSIERNRQLIRDRLREEYPWWVPEFIDEKIFRKIMARIEEIFADILTDSGHEVRLKFDETVNRFIDKLMDSDRMDKELQKWRENFLSDPSVMERFDSFWQELKARFIEEMKSPEAPVRQQMETTIMAIGAFIERDGHIRDAVNVWMRSSIVNVTEEYGDAIISIVSDTVKRWDPERTSERIELFVGKDLQWIRVNGTLVGGLAGLLIYLVSRFF